MIAETVMDVLVVGRGAAGIAAARAAHAAGARVTMVSDHDGGTALSAGWIGAGDTTLDPEALAWLPSVGLRPAGAYGFASVAGGLAAGVSGLPSLLDLSDVPDGPVAVLDLVAGTLWSASLVAASLTGTLRREVQVLTPAGVVPSANSSLALARALDTEGMVAGLGAWLRTHATDYAAVLCPPVLGLHRDDVAVRLTALAGRPVGESGGTAQDAPAVRLGRALARGVPEGVVRTHGRIAAFDPREGARVRLVANGAAFVAGAVVLAAGSWLTGGIVYDGAVREPLADAPVWLTDRCALPAQSASRGMDPTRLFTPDEAGRTPAAGAGIRVSSEGRVLGPDGAKPIAPWLFAAGGMLAGGGGAYGHALAAALTTGHNAGRHAAAHARSHG